MQFLYSVTFVRLDLSCSTEYRAVEQMNNQGHTHGVSSQRKYGPSFSYFPSAGLISIEKFNTIVLSAAVERRC
jgi:hypothetical protein